MRQITRIFLVGFVASVLRSQEEPRSSRNTRSRRIKKKSASSAVNNQNQTHEKNPAGVRLRRDCFAIRCEVVACEVEWEDGTGRNKLRRGLLSVRRRSLHGRVS